MTQCFQKYWRGSYFRKIILLYAKMRIRYLLVLQCISKLVLCYQSSPYRMCQWYFTIFVLANSCHTSVSSPNSEVIRLNKHTYISANYRHPDKGSKQNTWCKCCQRFNPVIGMMPVHKLYRISQWKTKKDIVLRQNMKVLLFRGPGYPADAQLQSLEVVLCQNRDLNNCNCNCKLMNKRWVL